MTTPRERLKQIQQGLLTGLQELREGKITPKQANQQTREAGKELRVIEASLEASLPKQARRSRQPRQKGFISTENSSWILRFRETVPDGNGGTVRKLRYKVLGPVQPEHRRNKDREGNLRIPKEIQAIADDITGTANNSKASVSVLATIAEFVDKTYLPEKQTALKASSYEVLKNRWNYYLKARIGDCVMRDYERADAAQLWRNIQKKMPHLSSQTFRHIRFTLRGIFEVAKDLGIYKGENPATALLPPNLPAMADTRVYTVEEVARILQLLTANIMGQAIIALAFGGGLRKGELAALDWKNYQPTDTGATIHVRASAWRGKLTTPKTESSADATAVDSEICAYVEAYREFLGNPTEGLMFGYSKDEPINLDSFSRWQIIPLLNRCAVCRKHEGVHAKEDHKFERDQTLPEWKGWHAFRRGAATFAAKKLAGEGTTAASLLLRHSDEGVTEDRYIKETKQERRARQAAKVINIQKQRQQAAGAIGAGLKAASTN